MGDEPAAEEMDDEALERQFALLEISVNSRLPPDQRPQPLPDLAAAMPPLPAEPEFEDPELGD